MRPARIHHPSGPPLRTTEPSARATQAPAPLSSVSPPVHGSPGLIQARSLADNSPRGLVQRRMAKTMENSPRTASHRWSSAELSGTAQAMREPAEGPRSGAGGLPANLQSGIESLSGLPMDHVRVHYNSDRPAGLNALAYAQGSDIHVAPGQERHLPHEAWHVVQQAQGRVKPTFQMKAGVPINDQPGLEREADVMGRRAAATKPPPAQRAGAKKKKKA